MPPTDAELKSNFYPKWEYISFLGMIGTPIDHEVHRRKRSSGAFFLIVF
jgi:hypothetical protein